MGESSPLLRQESEANRSLQDRIVNIFRPTSSSRIESNDDSSRNTPGLGVTDASELDARTRLLESYHRSDPVCGERRCSHGTFSPRPDEAHTSQYHEALGAAVWIQQWWQFWCCGVQSPPR